MHVTHQLERIWRRLMTLCCFGLFGLGALLLVLTWFNFLFVWCRNKEKRLQIARRTVCYSFRLFLWTAKSVGAMRCHFEGVEKLQQDQGCLILANHPTLLDYVLIASIMPDVDCLVKSTLLKNPFLSGVIRACHYLRNNQHAVLLTQCQERLARGANILIFPAGTRTTEGIKIPFQRGAANIALRCRCPVRFIHIKSNEKALTKQSKWYEIPKQRLTFTIVVGEKLSVDELIPLSELPSTSLQARQLTQLFEMHLI